MANETQENSELEFYRAYLALVECTKRLFVYGEVTVIGFTKNHEMLDYQRRVGNKTSQYQQQVDPVLLNAKLNETFNKGELRNLAFHLGVEYENLEGQTKTEKTQSLVEYCNRHKCTQELVTECSQLRPNIDWLNLRKNSCFANSLAAYNKSM